MRDATAQYDGTKDFLVPVAGVSPGIHGNQGVHPVTPGVVSGVKATQEAAEVTDALLWQPDIDSIAVTPATATVAKDATEDLTATATLKDKASTAVVTADAVWESSDETVATVVAGVVTVLKATGTATIAATYKGKSDTSAITASS